MAKKKRTTSEGGYNTFRNRLGHYFLGVVLVIGGPVFSIYFLPRLLEGRASENWPTAKGKITQADLVEIQDITGLHFETKVRYTFKVDGKEFSGDRLKIGGKSTNEQDAKADHRRYERAREIEVRYNPSDPSRSTLETGATTGNLILVAAVGPAILLFGVLLLGVGILMTLLARNRESADEEDEDADEDEEEERPKTRKVKRKTAEPDEEKRPRKAKRRAADDDEEEEPPRKRKPR
jgi:Protein of unknown function (DUF3592)